MSYISENSSRTLKTYMSLCYKNYVKSRLDRRTLETGLKVWGPGCNFGDVEVEFMFRKMGTGVRGRTKGKVA
jgi:hypothetical protein